MPPVPNQGSVGWFPEYCITEDYALSMELRAAGFKVGPNACLGLAAGLRRVLHQLPARLCSRGRRLPAFDHRFRPQSNPAKPPPGPACTHQGRYLAEYLAVGEAPEELRNVLRQRSRWCKGHMQVRRGF